MKAGMMVRNRELSAAVVTLEMSERRARSGLASMVETVMQQVLRAELMRDNAELDSHVKTELAAIIEKLRCAVMRATE